MRAEKIFLFQFPLPFPEFVSPTPQVADQNASTPSSLVTKSADKGKKVTFAPDVKAASTSGTSTPVTVTETIPGNSIVDGVIGQLEIHKSGAVRMRLENGMLFDVSQHHHYSRHDN